MITKKFKLNKHNGFSMDYEINPEEPYWEIDRVEIVNPKKGIQVNQLQLEYKYYTTQKQQSQTITLEFNTDHSNNDIWTCKLGNAITPRGYKKINFKILFSVSMDEFSEDFALMVYYRNLNCIVDLKGPSQTFLNHIEDETNTKILFSGEFGQGKTTFLNYFFEKREKEYSVIKVFPVNYSVSSNEDIFRYIKCDILFQLLEMGLELKSENTSYQKSLSKFLGENAHKVVAAFIGMIPQVGKDLYEIIERFDDLKEKYLEYHDGLQKNDFESAKVYIEELYNREGGLFEENFYTQLIRELLKQIEDSGKKTILVIEDLDRIDPDHIFRILNVISAHYDNQFNSQDSYNKFGFNKIIIVCDFNNIKNIFHYRYGPDVNFAGYINKFYSIRPFFFKNYDAIIDIMGQIEQAIYNRKKINENNRYHQIINRVLSDLIRNKQISLREILKLKSQNFLQIESSTKDYLSRHADAYRSSIFYPIIEYFSALGNANVFLKKLKDYRPWVVDDSDFNSKEFFPYALPMLGHNATTIGHKRYQFQVRPITDYINVASNISLERTNGAPLVDFEFTLADFYDTFIECVEVYIKIRDIY